MDVYQAIKSRRTVRDYKPDLIPEDVLRKICRRHGGRLALAIRRSGHLS